MRRNLYFMPRASQPQDAARNWTFQQPFILVPSEMGRQEIEPVNKVNCKDWGSFHPEGRLILPNELREKYLSDTWPVKEIIKKGKPALP